MSARLFRRIKTIFSRLNKTIALTALALIGTAFLLSPIRIFAANPLTKANLDAQYATYINNFSSGSGISGGTIQKSTATNTVQGLAFTINLKIALSGNGDTDEAHWDKVEKNSTQNFVIQVCENSNTNNCWLNTVLFDLKDPNPGNDKLFIYAKSTEGNYVDNLTVPVSAFAADGSNVYTYNPSANTASSVSNISFKQGDSLTASLWYCATGDGSDAVSTYQSNKIATTNPATFGSVCGGASFFQIGSPLPITIPTDATTLQQQAATSQQTLAQTQTSSSTDDDGLPECAISHPISGTFNGCLAQAAYGIYNLAAWIAGLLGQLFDFFIGYSVSDASYRYAFAVTGWKLVRDISNIFFIIILVYTGFSAVFNTSKSSMKQVVPNIIINALLINFSLFATRIVIDISNVTARVFYSQMVVCDQASIDPTTNTCPPAQVKRSLGGYWPLSEKIISSFNPQKIFTTNVLQTPNYGTLTGALTSSPTSAPTQKPLSANDEAIYFGIICIVATFIMLAIAIMFFKVAFLFVGRVVGLYICMIFSPFAFLSQNIPMLSKVERLRWTDWSSELANYAMLAPVFIFFLYIIYVVLTSSFVQDIGVANTSNGSIFGTIMAIAIPMAIIYFLIDAARKTAERLSGDIGKSIQSFGNTITGFAVGAATGGAALVGGRVVGGLAKRVDESNVGVGIRNLAANKYFGGIGRTLQKGINATRSGSFDVRQTTAGSALFKQLGINTNQKSLNALAGIGLGLGVDQRKGGREADIKRREERQVADEKLLEEKNGENIKAYNEKVKKKYDKKIEKVLEAQMLADGRTQAQIDAAKTARDNKENPDPTIYNEYRTQALTNTNTQTTINNIEAPKTVATAEELTSSRRKKYADNLKTGGPITQGLNWLGQQGQEGAAVAGLLRATVGAAIGSEVRAEGSKRASKKIEERSKAQKELEKIEETLKNGFTNLIATQKFANSNGLNVLTPLEREELFNTGKVQTGAYKGKKLYDLLEPDEQAAVDAERIALQADKASREKIEHQVQVVEQSRYNMGELKKELKRQRTGMASGDLVATKKYWATFREIEEAEKHQKIWGDISKYREDQKKKAKGEESK